VAAAFSIAFDSSAFEAESGAFLTGVSAASSTGSALAVDTTGTFDSGAFAADGFNVNALTVSGASALSSVGSVTVSVGFTFTVPSVSATGSAGSASAIGAALADPAGVSGSASIGTVSIPVYALPTGVSATVALGSAAVIGTDGAFDAGAFNSDAFFGNSNVTNGAGASGQIGTVTVAHGA
jgi:hypothetical protein